MFRILEGGRRCLAVACVLPVLAVVAAGCGSDDGGGGGDGAAAGGDGGGGKTYKIVLSNNFVGNQWRIEMQNIAKAMAENNAPYKGRVELDVQVAEGDPTAQINSLNSIIATKPDAILIDAASPTALNPVIKKACTQDIVVVSFDQPVTEKCAYRISTDTGPQFNSNASWLVKTMKGKNVVQDLGLPGVPLSQISKKEADEVFKANDLNVLATYEGNFAPGPSKQAMAPILAANSDIDGVYTNAGADGVVEAFTQAKRQLVPMVNTGDISVRMINLVKEHKAKGLEFQFALLPPTFGGYAMDLAFRVLEGESPVNEEFGTKPGADDKAVLLPLQAYNTNGVATEGVEVLPFEQLVKDSEGLADDVQLPYSIPESPVTKEQALGK